MNTVKWNTLCSDRLVDSKKIAEQRLDKTQALDVMVVPLERAVDMVMTNEICCNSSAHGILKAARILGNKGERHGVYERI